MTTMTNSLSGLFVGGLIVGTGTAVMAVLLLVTRHEEDDPEKGAWEDTDTPAAFYEEAPSRDGLGTSWFPKPTANY